MCSICSRGEIAYANISISVLKLSQNVNIGNVQRNLVGKFVHRNVPIQLTIEHVFRKLTKKHTKLYKIEFFIDTLYDKKFAAYIRQHTKINL